MPRSRNLTVRSTAHRYMEEMSQYAQAPVALAARDRLNMLYLDVVQTNSKIRRPIGSTLPLYSSSMGRACLAATPEFERKRLLEAIQKKHPEEWPQIETMLKKHLKSTPSTDIVCLWAIGSKALTQLQYPRQFKARHLCI